MSPQETRLLVIFLFVVGVGATAFHALTRLDAAPPPELTVKASKSSIAPRNEAVLLTLGAQAKTFEPTTPAGSWRFVWEGRPSALLDTWSKAEAVPGGYFVTSSSLQETAPGVWSLDLVLSPWREDLTPPPDDAPRLDAAKVALALGEVPTVRTAVKPVTPAAAPVAPPATPTPGPANADDLIVLGSYGNDQGRHWWLKEKGTDRVFQVPGAEDWVLVQADGAALILQKAGKLYRLALTP